MAEFTNIDKLADKDLRKKKYNIKGEIQSKVHNDIYFKYNSVNLVIGKRGSGKTFMVMREMLKLAYLMHGFRSRYPTYNNYPQYTQIIYITDKLRDDTCERAIHYINKLESVQFEWTSTDEALNIINGLSALKAFLANHKEYKKEMSKEEYEAAIVKSKEILNCQELTTIPHTVIIFDDCIGLFNKYSPLSKKLFENRQSRITYFLILQDVQGLNPSMKANVDSLVLFGGFPKHKWNSLTYQMPLIDPDYTFANYYSKLSSHDFVFFDYVANKIYEKLRHSDYIERPGRPEEDEEDEEYEEEDMDLSKLFPQTY